LPPVSFSPKYFSKFGGYVSKTIFLVLLTQLFSF
jgi:hypothetical protein